MSSTTVRPICRFATMYTLYHESLRPACEEEERETNKILHQPSNLFVASSTVQAAMKSETNGAIRASLRFSRWPPVPIASFPIHDINISGNRAFVGRKTALDKLNQLLVDLLEVVPHSLRGV